MEDEVLEINVTECHKCAQSFAAGDAHSCAFTCTECARAFKSERALKSSKNRWKKPMNTRLKLSISFANSCHTCFICQKCSRIFANKSNLNRHQERCAIKENQSVTKTSFATEDEAVRFIGAMNQSANLFLARQPATTAKGIFLQKTGWSQMGRAMSTIDARVHWRKLYPRRKNSCPSGVSFGWTSSALSPLPWSPGSTFWTSLFLQKLWRWAIWSKHQMLQTQPRDDQAAASAVAQLQRGDPTTLRAIQVCWNCCRSILWFEIQISSMLSEKRMKKLRDNPGIKLTKDDTVNLHDIANVVRVKTPKSGFSSYGAYIHLAVQLESQDGNNVIYASSTTGTTGWKSLISRNASQYFRVKKRLKISQIPIR